MKKIVPLYGLLTGLIISSFMVYSAGECYSDPDFNNNYVMGSIIMLLGFSFVFIGIKQYRDKHLDGIINFGQAFKAGLYISLVACSMYVAVWLVDYYLFIPEFMDRYIDHVLKDAQADGPEALASKVTEMANMKELYKNPLMVILFTYAEVFPLGLGVSLISSFILKRKQVPASE